MTEHTSSNVKVEFNLRDAGWASCGISVGDKSYEYDGVSYLTDALDDLLRAALMVATGAYRYEFHFQDEPGESRWILVAKYDGEEWRKLLELTILEFPDAYPRKPDKKGKVAFKAECCPEEFAHAVYQTANDIWTRLGPDGYNEKWTGQQGFPVRAFKALEMALSLAELPPKDV